MIFLRIWKRSESELNTMKKDFVVTDLISTCVTKGRVHFAGLSSRHVDYQTSKIASALKNNFDSVSFLRQYLGRFFHEVLSLQNDLRLKRTSFFRYNLITIDYS